MQNKFRGVFIVALALIWSLFSGCAYLAAPNVPFHQDQVQETFSFETIIDKCINETDVSFTLADESDLSVKRFDSKYEPDEKDKADAMAAQPFLRFVWLSDVHIPQREIRLYTKEVSNVLAEFVSATEYNKAQEDFHWAVYLSQIEAINALNREMPIDFMIHTGDAVLRGSLEELYQFIYISNKLDVPWLNVVGNHDISLFGNYRERLGYGRDPNVIFYPMGDLGSFIWMHRSFCSEGKPQIASPQRNREYCLSGYGRHLLPVPANCEHGPSMGNPTLVPTFHHGFDLNLDITCDKEPSTILPKNLPYDDALGDYATDLCGISIPVRLIALNSVKKDAFGASSQITVDQVEWLKSKLLKKSGDINLVFQHHPVKENNQVKGLLADSGNATVLAFTGHIHPESKYDITWSPGKKGSGFYELNTGAVLEYPQIARLIELRQDSRGRVWLITRALWSSLMKVHPQDMPNDEMERKEFIDKCSPSKPDKLDTPEERKEWEAKQKQCEAMQNYLPDAVRCGQFGAYDDYLANKRRGGNWWFTLFSRQTGFKEIWRNANRIVDITPYSDK